MASELPDALEKLDMKTDASERSLSKYFGEPDSADDIFDTIAKPPPEAAAIVEEPKINFFKSPVKEEIQATPGSTVKQSPTVSFKKGNDEEPKIFSYFSQPENQAASSSSKDSDATEFFDQISELAAKKHEPLEITINSSLVDPAPAAAVPIFTPVAPAVLTPIINVMTIIPTEQKTWSHTQEMAAGWWIASEKTQRWLQSSPPASVDSNDLTSPTLSNTAELTDPMKDLLRHFDGETAAAERQTLTADLVSQDDQGILTLIKSGCWRAGANLCGRLLIAYGQGYGKQQQASKHTPHTLQLWLTRLAVLVQSHLYEMAYTEVSAFGDLESPDLYYDYYPTEYQGRRGTMVPFSLRLLAAQIPARYQRPDESQRKLCRLLYTVRKIIRQLQQFVPYNWSAEERQEAARLWAEREARVVQALIHCALVNKDFHNAVQLLRKKLEPGADPSLWPPAACHSSLGRIYLQLGDVQRAQQSFNRAADLRQASDSVASLLDAALVAVAQNAFTEAHTLLQKAFSTQPDHPLLVNNVAVSLLYLGHMRDSMLLLEEKLGTRPDAMMADASVTNVCTLYELESSLTNQRKLGMLRLAARWRNDSLHVSSFKL